MQIPQLTFTRFVAALAVVVLHFGLFSWPFDAPLISQLAYKFVAAVSYFFLLSGFILVIASKKNESDLNDAALDLKNFWIKRAARILPLYVLSITIYFFFHFDYNPEIPLKWQVQSYVYSLFLIQTWNYPMAIDINMPAWSLSVEAFLYFIFPWLYKYLNRYQTKNLIILSLVCWIGNTLLFKGMIAAGLPHNLTHYFPVFHVATFLIGIVAGVLFIRHHEIIFHKRVVLGIFATLASVFVIYTACQNWSFYAYCDNGLLAPYFILIIYALAVSKGMLIDVFASKPFVFMGDISYAIYLFQVPVLEISLKYLPAFQEKEIKDIFYWYVLLLILVSIVMHLCIEKPLRKRISQFFTLKTL